LESLYGHTGRRADWARRVEEVKDDFIDLKTDGPLAGREYEWLLVNDYRVGLAQEARQWTEAERLQRTAVHWAREQAAAALALPTEVLNWAQRNRIRSLAVSLQSLGNIRRERGQDDCVISYAEAAEMAERVEDRSVGAAIAFNLGHAYMNLPAVRDIAEAERWYRRSLGIYEEEEQHHHRAQCLNQLGSIAFEHFREASAATRPRNGLVEHLNAALSSYHEALDLFPRDAVGDLAVTHHAIGVIYGLTGDIDRALPHYQYAIRYREKQGNLYGAAQARFSVAADFANAGRLADARAYAHAALRNFETYGDRATDMLQRTHQLLSAIDQSPNPRIPS
jgi:tetratricopeptide (TPR) repeat protein